MKVYQDLVIRGGRLGPSEFIELLERCLKSGWTRNLVLEERVGTAVSPMYCFSCSEQSHRLGADLWMARNEDGELHVCNILAHERQQTTYSQYNAILNNFRKVPAQPAAESCGAVAELGNADPGIEALASPETCQLLRGFSRAANRSGSHPSDRERWYRFVSAAYREKSALDPHMLDRWFIEEEKWPAEAAHQLALEYETALELLAVFTRPIRPKTKAAGRE